jgi:1-acyl-sn-glycerol-3-phosphate acyltransferase
MLLVRSLVFSAAFYAMTAAFAVACAPLLFAPRRYAMMGLKAHARACLWLLRVIMGIGVEVRGAGNIPDGPAIVAAKHHSTWETFALIPFFTDPAMVMKAELGWIPFYGWFAYKLEHLLVARGRGPQALRQLIAGARERVALGRQIVIFPEGTRRKVSAPPCYKPGVVALYEALNVPCVPVALNSGLYWPGRGVMRYPGTIVVEFLPPIAPGFPRAEFRQMLESEIEEATQRLVASPVSLAAGRPAQAQVPNKDRTNN